LGGLSPQKPPWRRDWYRTKLVWKYQQRFNLPLSNKILEKRKTEQATM